MRRLGVRIGVGFVLGLATLGLSAPAEAACVGSSATRPELLRSAISGGFDGVGANTVFAAYVTARRAALRASGSGDHPSIQPGVYTPVDVRVVVLFRGRAAATSTVLTPGGAVDGVGEGVEDAPTLAGDGLQLVLAHRSADGTLYAVGGCSGISTISGAELAALVASARGHATVLDHAAFAQLAATGHHTLDEATLGAVLIALGLALINASRHRRLGGQTHREQVRS